MQNRKSFLAGNRVTIALITAIVMLLCTMVPVLAAESEASYKQSLIDAGFPSTYVDKLYTIHKAHPNWEFVPYNTAIDWNTAVDNETSAGKNTVYITPNGTSATRLYRSESYGSYTSKSGFDYDYVVRDGSDANQSGWVDASRMAIAYYMNPYNFIGNDVTILQFESLGWEFGTTTSEFNEAVSTVETMLSGTFMSSSSNKYNSDYIDSSGNIKYINTSGSTKTLSFSYAYAICLAAKECGINPCYLASKILGEVGNTGSGSTTGTYSTDLTGYYNYLNVGAYDSSTGGAITNGLTYAKNQDWTNPYLSILGGAETIASSYIAQGQNTAYFQKYNVTTYKTYSHQYMTAVNGVVNTTYSTYTGYKNAGILDSKKTFLIPVYKNMPDATGTSVSLTGYNSGTTQGTTNAAVNLRDEASYAGSKIGSVSSGSTVTVLGGYRDQRVTYDSSYKINATYYRMYTPIWYKVKTSSGTTGYICEDYLDINNTYTLKTGKKLGLTGSVTGSEKPQFMSLDTRIATVSSDGVITAVSEGTTKIVVYLSNGAFDVLNLTVSSSGKTPSRTTASFTYSKSGSGTVSGNGNGATGNTSSSIGTTTTTTKTTTTTTKSTTKSTTTTTKSTTTTTKSTTSSVTGLAYCSSDGNWYYYKNGKIDTTANGLYQNEYGWWKVENGKVNFQFEGLACNEYGWWYLKGGCVNFTYNGLVRNEYGRWYVKNGAVQFEFNGIVPTSSGKWYIRDGAVKTSFTGTATINGKTYTITNGKVS